MAPAADTISAAFFGLFFFVLVNRNRIQVFGLKNLAAIETSNVIDAIATVEEFGSLVLTSLHSEIKPILD